MRMRDGLGIGESPNNDQVVVMVDDLMWGPLGNVLSDHVQAVRLNWWSLLKSILNIKR
jgi:hypothetical protein